MANDVILPIPAGATNGDTARAIDKGGVKTQVVTLDLGGSGAESLVAGTMPVSGTVTATGPLTDTQLRATAVPISGAVTTSDPDIVASGTITTTDVAVAAPGGAGAVVSGTSTAGSYVTALSVGGDSAWNVQITGLTSGTLYFEGSLDSTNGIDGNWINVNGRQTGIVNTVLSGNSTTNGVYRGNTSGLKYFRVRSVGALTGTPAIVIRLSAGVGAVFLNASIPAGTNSLGAVTLNGLSTVTPGDSASGLPVRQVPSDSWRVSFADVGSGLQTTEMTTLQTGSGHAISQSAGNLVITSGTTANAETLIRSNRTFKGALQIRHKSILSQRIANNNFSVELADLVGTGLSYSITNATTVVVTFAAGQNPYTAKNVGQFNHISCITGAAGIPGRFAIASTSGDTVTFTVAGWPASGSGTLMLWGWNYYRCLYTSTTATNAAWDAQRKGWASGDTTLTVNTTASPGHVFQTQTSGTIASAADALVASSAAIAFTARGSRLEGLPDDDAAMYLFIRVLNGTSAPASTTTWTVGFVQVEEHGRQKVYTAGADQAGASFAAPVQVVGGVLSTQPVSGTVTATVTGGTVLPVTPTTANTNSAATTNATSTKASAGTVWSVVASNINAAARYLKLYNLAVAPTVGTSVPFITLKIPADDVIRLDGGSNGIRFSTGIAWALTTENTDAGTTAVAANEIKVLITYT